MTKANFLDKWVTSDNEEIKTDLNSVIEDELKKFARHIFKNNQKIFIKHITLHVNAVDAEIEMVKDYLNQKL